MYIRKHIFRFTAVFLFLFICLIVFSVKLILIQVFKSAHLSALATKQQNYLIELEPVRGTIFDRNLRPMAFNISVYSLFANPKAMTQRDKSLAINQLSILLEEDPNSLANKLDKDKYFVWLKRKISAELAEKVKKLNINGLGFRKESKRFYPNGSLAAHVIGFADIDNEGREGLEMVYNKFLKGTPGQMEILRDAKQRELLIEKEYIAPVDGLQIVLTIDETIQYLAENALEKGLEKFNAKAASIIVMDVKTGEILAFANRPTYNLDDFKSSSIESRTNRAISFIYEPGSVFKIVAASAALEEGVFNERDKIFCENGEYRIANHILHDAHPYGTLTFQEVIEKSSNIGVAKIAQKLGPNKLYQYAKKFRFGLKTGINLDGEISGLMKNPSSWSKTSIGAIPIGQEVTVTSIQLISAINAIANDGVFMKPYLVKYIKDNKGEIVENFEPQIVDRVITSETAKRLNEILVGVTERGTAKNAAIKGIRVAGKTGTAQKVVNGIYSHSSFYSTFMGYAPADNPRLSAIVIYDDPHPYYYGGTVCAPVFKEVIENSLKYLDSQSF